MADQSDSAGFEFLWDKAQKARMPRRQFLRLLAMGGAALVLEACAPAATPTAIPTATAIPHTATPSLTPTLEPTATVTPTSTSTTTITPTPTPKSLGPFKPATYAKLPRWRGFNLLNKWSHLNPQRNRPYDEWNFDFMVENGFDFVRLATDYKVWTVSPGNYLEQPLKEIDQAIAWARQRGIHASLEMHHAPGYSMVDPKEPRTLWSDGPDGDEARRQFVAQWGMLATRYRGIPSAELSFDLVNEPPDLTGNQYLHAVSPAIAAIRATDPNRLIIAEGSSTATVPVPELIPLKIAQSAHCYAPFSVTLYRASWSIGSGQMAPPTWPILLAINQFLYGDWKSDFRSPIVLKGNFSESATVSIRVQIVTTRVQILMHADGTTILDQTLQPGPGQGEWKTSTFLPQWNTYQATYDKDYTITIPAGTREIRIEVGHGDWLSFSEIRIAPFSGVPTNEVVIQPAYSEWGIRQAPVVLDPHGNVIPENKEVLFDKAKLRATEIDPWQRFRDSGIGVHIGEFGVYNQTPHAVALAWMRDNLDLFREAGFGWALWELSGEFGVLDSGRSDVDYEDYKGHKLDREMLELLKQG